MTFIIPRAEIVDGRFGGTIAHLEAYSNAVEFFVYGQWWPGSLGEYVGFYDGTKVSALNGKVYTIVINVPVLPLLEAVVDELGLGMHDFDRDVVLENISFAIEVLQDRDPVHYGMVIEVLQFLRLSVEMFDPDSSPQFFFDMIVQNANFALSLYTAFSTF